MATAVGTTTKTGIGLEGAYGTPVKAQALLDTRSNTIAGEYQRIESQALKPSRFKRVGVAGAGAIGGGFQCEVTPDLFTKILLAALGTVVTTGAAAPFTHTFSAAATGPKPVTMSKTLGDIIAIHSCLINLLTMRADLDEMLLADVEVVGRSETIYGNDGATDTLVFGTAAYPVGPCYTFKQATVKLGGVTTNEVGSCNVAINNNLFDKRVLGFTFPTAQAPGMLDATYELDLYFSSDAELRKALGVASGAAYPFNVTDTTLTSAVELKFVSGTNELVIGSTNCEATAPLPPTETAEYLRQRVTYQARDLSVVVKNAEANATVIAGGTAIGA